MNILVNCSNLSGGGGVQVADSIIRLLNNFREFNFIVVGADAMNPTLEAVKDYDNVRTVKYNYPPADIKSFITQRNKFLDDIVEKNAVECVLTVFGPMKWRPRCRHVSGFAIAHLVLKDSPFFDKIPIKERLKWKLRIKLWEIIFRRSSKCFYTENEYISSRIRELFKGSTVYTVSNYYHQVFDNPGDQVDYNLPPFEGFQMLDIASAGLHKNQEIAIRISDVLRKKYPDFKFRFIFTLSDKQFPEIPTNLKENILLIGKVSVNQCPSLYRQVDASFQPTLLECFTATYVESMRMEIPIITTDLEFAKGICHDAAAYYSAIDPFSAAEAIFRVATSPDYYTNLVKAGKRRLKCFDNQKERVEKLLKICSAQ